MSYENEEYILQFFKGVHEEGSRIELIEVYRKAKAWDKLYEYVSTTPYDGIDIDTLKNRLDRLLNESGE